MNSIAPTRKGLFTGNNDMWLKLWYEINKTDFCATFKPYNKGGEYRKWFGNNEYVINWGEDGESVKSYKGSGNITDKLFFHPCLTWSLVTSYKPSFRAIIDYDHVMGDAGPIVVASKDDFYYLLALLNSKFTDEIASLIAPTINFSNGAAGTIPVILPQASTRSIIEKMSIENVNSSKKDWDAFETSWDFERHPLV